MNQERNSYLLQISVDQMLAQARKMTGIDIIEVAHTLTPADTQRCMPPSMTNSLLVQ